MAGNLQKALITIGGFAALLFGIRAYRAFTVGSNISMSITNLRFTLKLLQTTMTVDVILKNPTQSSADITFPFVQVFAKDEFLGESQKVSNQIIRIQPLGTTVVKNLSIDISHVSVAVVLYKAYNSQYSGKTEQQRIDSFKSNPMGILKALEAYYTVNTYANGIPDTQKYPLT